MSDKILYINTETGKLITSSGGQLLTKPTISYKAQPIWELHFVQIDADGSLNPVDLSARSGMESSY